MFFCIKTFYFFCLDVCENLSNSCYIHTLFYQVNPTYHAALRALKALDPKATEEIKSYRVPPDGVTMVMNTICLLFRVPQT